MVTSVIVLADNSSHCSRCSAGRNELVVDTLDRTALLQLTFAKLCQVSCLLLFLAELAGTCHCTRCSCYSVSPFCCSWCYMHSLLRSCGRLVCQSARSLILGQPCLLPWELQGLTTNSRTVPAPQLRLLGSWAPFWADYLASVITRCRYTMLIMMIALLFMCRCGLWVRDLLVFRPLFSLNSSGIWC